MFKTLQLLEIEVSNVVALQLHKDIIVVNQAPLSREAAADQPIRQAILSAVQVTCSKRAGPRDRLAAILLHLITIVLTLRHDHQVEEVA